MEVKETYPTLEAAKVGIQAHEKQGHRTLHENHLYREVLDVIDSQAGEVGTRIEFDYAEVVYETVPDNTPLPIANPKAEYALASTDADRLAIIAKRLGLT